jgi:DNA-binding GntR family transcriptional regulator
MNAPLKHRTLSAVIADRVREGILAGEHAGGAQLRQDALADAFGVSRIPVREALFQLEAEGLVRMVPHKGAVVSELSLDEVNDVFDLRTLLEPRLLASSAPMLSKADLQGIDRIQRDFVEAIAQRDLARWGSLNADLHMALYARGGQPRTLSIVASLLQTSDRYTRLQLNTPKAMATAEREHAELIALCRAGKVNAACETLKRHIEAVRGGLLKVLPKMAVSAKD